MIPLRDNVPSRHFPIINTLLIALNFVIFIHELTVGPARLHAIIYTYGIIPAQLHQGQGYLTLVTAQFLHGSWVHILGNMLFLWVFGDNVEDRMGHGRYLLFYLLVGVVANGAHALAAVDATVPTIGASGAIAGVLGGYLISYPRARVLTLVILVIFVTVVELPAWVFLLYWFGLQLLSGFTSLTATAAQFSGIAWWAHIGGFVAGAVMVPLFQQHAYRPRYE